MRVIRSVLLTILVLSVVIGACYAQCPPAKCRQCGVAGSNPCAFDYRCCPAYQGSCPYGTQGQSGAGPKTQSGYMMNYQYGTTMQGQTGKMGSQSGAGPQSQMGTTTSNQVGTFGQGSISQPGTYGQGSSTMYSQPGTSGQGSSMMYSQPGTSTQSGTMMNYQYGTTMQGQYGTTMQDQSSAMSPDMSMQSGGAAYGAGPGGMMAAGMMSSIAVDDSSIYVLRGSEIVKISKSNMQVASTMTLPPIGGAQQTASAAGAGPTAPAAPTATVSTSLIVRQSAQDQINSMRQLSSPDFEKTYLQTIINSHAGAIAWSQLATCQATHPELRQFAQSVINDESSVNRQFNTWLNNFYGTGATPTITQSDTTVLNNLQNLSGSNFEIAYMKAMINHFSEAVVLSRDAAQKAVHADIKNTASSMATMHTTQIQQLRTWLSSWYNVSY